MANTGTALGPGNYALDLGVDTIVVAGAVATGVAKSSVFAVPVRPSGGDVTVIFQAFETAITVLTIDLQRSVDGGTTFAPLSSGLNVHTGPQRVTPVPPGVYRVNIASITGTSADINATMA